MHRIVIYRAGPTREDSELLAAIASRAGIEQESVAALLRSPGPAHLENLDEAAARDLLELLAERGIDADLEPMRPPAGALEWLRGEAPKWVKRGLVHPDSLARIFANYGLEPPAAPGPPAAAAPATKQVGTGTLLRAVLTLGAVLVGLGLILFVAANWQRIPAPAKILGSLALTLAALHAGSRLAGAPRPRPRLAAALLLIALFGIGAVVILIAQAYHVLSDSYLLPLLWGALCVPVALLQRFRPALYVASGLWLVSYWLHLGELGRLPWVYPVLLAGLLLYGVIAEARRFHVTHLGVVMAALTTTLVPGDMWHGSAFVAALALLRLRYREPLYDWLLMAGFFIWQFVFLVRFEDLPNVFYALPLAYFFYRAHAERSNAMMIATLVNTQIWLGILLYQTGERLDVGAVEETGVLLWLTAAGLLWFGIGKRLEPSPQWRHLSTFLRFGGGALAGLMVYLLSFTFYKDAESFYGSPLFLGTTLVFGGAGVALAAAALRRADAKSRRWGTSLLLALTATSLVLSFLAPPSLWIHPLVFNLTLFAGALGMMLRGHRSQSLAWFNAGITVFVVFITSRYLDTFVEYLPRSVFFVLGGLFLIGWAVLVDRQRKRSAWQPAGRDDA